MFPKQQAKINLGQMLMVFVFSVTDLPEAFEITGDGRSVIGQVFLLCPALALKAEENVALPLR